jgi:hypothetical protein
LSRSRSCCARHSAGRFVVIPDYLLLTEDGPVVMDVKPASLLDDPAVAETFEWVRGVVESMGWSFEVASERPRVLYDIAL